MGEDPTRVEAIAAWLRAAAGTSGPGGIFSLALSAIDIACWDLKGKAAIPNGLTVEYMPWTRRLFKEHPAIEDGQLVVPPQDDTDRR